MAQKIIQIGSSAGITIPKDILAGMSVQIGDTIELQKDPQTGTVSIIPNPNKEKDSRNELIDWVEDAINRYRPALEALKDK
jgi:putative addiction module antidote